LPSHERSMVVAKTEQDKAMRMRQRYVGQRTPCAALC